MHIYGKGGLPVDMAEAKAWLQRSADQDFAAAQLHLAHMHQRGEGGLAKDPAAAEALRVRVHDKAMRGDTFARIAWRAATAMAAVTALREVGAAVEALAVSGKWWPAVVTRAHADGNVEDGIGTQWFRIPPKSIREGAVGDDGRGGGPGGSESEGGKVPTGSGITADEEETANAKLSAHRDVAHAAKERASEKRLRERKRLKRLEKKNRKKKEEQEALERRRREKEERRRKAEEARKACEAKAMAEEAERRARDSKARAKETKRRARIARKEAAAAAGGGDPAAAGLGGLGLAMGAGPRASDLRANLTRMFSSQLRRLRSARASGSFGGSGGKRHSPTGGGLKRKPTLALRRHDDDAFEQALLNFGSMGLGSGSSFGRRISQNAKRHNP